MATRTALIYVEQPLSDKTRESIDALRGRGWTTLVRAADMFIADRDVESADVVLVMDKGKSAKTVRKAYEDLNREVTAWGGIGDLPAARDWKTKSEAGKAESGTVLGREAEASGGQQEAAIARGESALQRDANVEEDASTLSQPDKEVEHDSPLDLLQSAPEPGTIEAAGGERVDESHVAGDETQSRATEEGVAPDKTPGDKEREAVEQERDAAKRRGPGRPPTRK